MAAVKETHVELAENQEAPSHPLNGVSKDVQVNVVQMASESGYELAKIDMLTPVHDAAGRWTVWKKVYCEAPKPQLLCSTCPEFVKCGENPVKDCPKNKEVKP